MTEKPCNPLHPSSPPAVITRTGARLLWLLVGWSFLSCVSLLAAGQQQGIIGEPTWAILFGVGGLAGFAYALDLSSTTRYTLTVVLLPIGPLGRSLAELLGAVVYEPHGSGWRILFSAIGWLLLAYLIRMAMRRMVPEPPAVDAGS